MPRAKIPDGQGGWIELDAKNADYASSAGNADTVDGKHASSFALSGHNHDDRYYTEAEINSLINSGVDIEVLSSDPNNPEAGRIWLRGDLNPGDSQLLRISNGEAVYPVLLGTYLYNIITREDLYSTGIEVVPFVAGYSLGNGTLLKNSDHLYLEAGKGASIDCVRTFVTDIPIDLSNRNTIYVDWEGFSVSYGAGKVNVSTNKMGDHDDYNAYVQISGTFTRRISTINVSNLNGVYYVRIHAFESTAVSIRYGKIKVYNLWAE